MAGSRKVDTLARSGSFADRLRRRRMAMDAGDPTGGAAFRPKVGKKKKAKAKVKKKVIRAR